MVLFLLRWSVILSVVLPCFERTTTTATAQIRCCPFASTSSKEGSGCLTQIQPQNVTSQHVQEVRCAPSQTLTHYDLNNDNGIRVEEDQAVFVYKLNGWFEKETEDYCIEAEGDGYKGAVCRPDAEKICNDAVCVPKCCGDGEVLVDYLQCQKGTGNLSLQFYSHSGEPIDEPAGDTVVMVGDMTPDCGKDREAGFKQDTSALHLLVSGRLLDTQGYVAYEFDQYCLEDSYFMGEHTVLYLTCTELESTAIYVKNILQKMGYVLSILFLAVTLLFHAIEPRLRDTPGLCLASHMASMLIMFTFMFINSQVSYKTPHWFCLLCGFVLHYAFLATFFWLNIMCFDIWRIIRQTAKAVPLRGILLNDAKKVKLYCVYGWGGPLIIVIVTAIIHSLPTEYTRNITPPGFGISTCWFYGNDELLIYCYGFVAALFILDLIFLGHIICILVQLGGSCNGCLASEITLQRFNNKHLEAL